MCTAALLLCARYCSITVVCALLFTAVCRVESLLSVGLRSKLSSGSRPLQISCRPSCVGWTALEGLESVATAPNQLSASCVGGTALESLEWVAIAPNQLSAFVRWWDCARSSRVGRYRSKSVAGIRALIGLRSKIFDMMFENPEGAMRAMRSLHTAVSNTEMESEVKYKHTPAVRPLFMVPRSRSQRFLT